MSVNGKQKGSRFERVICKWFTEWTGYEFNRVPASGGLRWKNAENITSDVACTDRKHSRKFCFSIECKSYKELNFEHIILEKKSCKILKFWDQVCNDAKRSGKLPILIMKYNGMNRGEAFVMIDNQVYQECILPQITNLTKPLMGFNLAPNKKVRETQIYVLRLSELKKLDYQSFHKQAQTLLKRESNKKF